MILRSAVALSVLVSIAAGGSALAAATAQTCAAAKVKAAGKGAGGALKCHASAAGKGQAVSADCVTTTKVKLTVAFDVTELKGACLTTDDDPAVQALIDELVSDLATALRPVPTVDACARAKLTAAAKKAKSLLACRAKAIRTGLPDTDPRIQGCLTKPPAKFTAAFAKAELAGGCNTSSDVSTIEDRVDAFVDETPAQLPSAPSAGVTVDPGQGANPAQVSFNWPGAEVPSSSTGQLDIDIAALQAATGMSSGYVNVRTSLGWVVQNLPVFAGFPYSTISTSFQVATSDGTPVSSLDAQVLFSADPLVSFATTAPNPGPLGALPPPPFSVGTVPFSGAGFDTPVGLGAPAAPAPRPVVFRVNGAEFTALQPNHPNIEAADNQCYPAAVANSTGWLASTYGILVPHPNVMGLGNDGSLVGQYESYMSRPYLNRRSGSPSSIANGLSGKLAYLAANGLGGLVAKHQGPYGNTNITISGMTSFGQGTIPTAAFLISEVAAGRDVEMGYLFPQGGGHMVEVVGAGTVRGVPWVAHRSDRDQTNDANGTGGIDFSYLWDTDGDGRLNLVNEATVPNMALLVSQGVTTTTTTVPVSTTTSTSLPPGCGDTVCNSPSENCVTCPIDCPPSYLGQWGTTGSGAGQFSNPYGIAVDSSADVYVSDWGNHRIQKFDSNGTFLTAWGSNGSGNGQFNFPFGVHVDASGNVYVADNGNHRIQKFDSSGTYLATIGAAGSGDGQFFFPWDVTTDASGNVYVADTQSNHRIQKFNSSGTFLLKWGGFGPGDGQFNFPAGIAVDASGNVYVGDTGNDRVQKFDGSGTFLTKWGSSGTGNGQFDAPVGITFDSAGDVYVVDSSNHRMQTFGASGTFYAAWGSHGAGNGQFELPNDAEFDSSDNVYVLDRDHNRVEKFSCSP